MTTVEEKVLCPVCAIKWPIRVPKGSVVEFYCRSMQCGGVWRTLDKRLPILLA